MIAGLFQKYLNNECTPVEFDRLMLLLENPANDGFKREIIRLQFEKRHKTSLSEQQELQAKLESSFTTILGQINSERVPKTRLYSLKWLRVAAAACIILISGLFGYYFFTNKPQQRIAKAETTKKLSKEDVLPGGNKATLTLGNGKRIILDSAAIGTLARQGNTKIMKLANGLLAYDGKNEKPAEVVYNLLTTPMGGQYELMLPDGSKVWLNTASSIKYPTTFAGNARSVEITGEAYFEIVHNASKPFTVGVGGTTVQVLGTHFNINSYADEATIKTTLLEGSVRVIKGDGVVVLVPGQQSTVDKSGKIGLINGADEEDAVSWKDGYFHFKSADLATVLRGLSRWYDVEIVYEGKKPDQYFSGDIEKNLNLSEVLNILEKSQVHFKIQGKKLIVMP